MSGASSYPAIPPPRPGFTLTFGASAYTIPSTAAMATAREARRGILVFLLLTFALSSVFYYLILSAGALSAGRIDRCPP